MRGTAAAAGNFNLGLNSTKAMEGAPPTPPQPTPQAVAQPYAQPAPHAPVGMPQGSIGGVQAAPAHLQQGHVHQAPAHHTPMIMPPPTRVVHVQPQAMAAASGAMFPQHVMAYTAPHSGPVASPPAAYAAVSGAPLVVPSPPAAFGLMGAPHMAMAMPQPLPVPSAPQVPQILTSAPVVAPPPPAASPPSAMAPPPAAPQHVPPAPSTPSPAAPQHVPAAPAARQHVPAAPAAPQHVPAAPSAPSPAAPSPAPAAPQPAPQAWPPAPAPAPVAPQVSAGLPALTHTMPSPHAGLDQLVAPQFAVSQPLTVMPSAPVAAPLQEPMAALGVPTSLPLHPQLNPPPPGQPFAGMYGMAFSGGQHYPPTLHHDVEEPAAKRLRQEPGAPSSTPQFHAGAFYMGGLPASVAPIAQGPDLGGAADFGEFEALLKGNVSDVGGLSLPMAPPMALAPPGKEAAAPGPTKKYPNIPDDLLPPLVQFVAGSGNAGVVAMASTFGKRYPSAGLPQRRIGDAIKAVAVKERREFPTATWYIREEFKSYMDMVAKPPEVEATLQRYVKKRARPVGAPAVAKAPRKPSRNTVVVAPHTHKTCDALLAAIKAALKAQAPAGAGLTPIPWYDVCTSDTLEGTTLKTPLDCQDLWKFLAYSRPMESRHMLEPDTDDEN